LLGGYGIDLVRLQRPDFQYGTMLAAAIVGGLGWCAGAIVAWHLARARPSASRVDVVLLVLAAVAVLWLGVSTAQSVRCSRFGPMIDQDGSLDEPLLPVIGVAYLIDGIVVAITLVGLAASRLVAQAAANGTRDAGQASAAYISILPTLHKGETRPADISATKEAHGCPSYHSCRFGARRNPTTATNQQMNKPNGIMISRATAASSTFGLHSPSYRSTIARIDKGTITARATLNAAAGAPVRIADPRSRRPPKRAATTGQAANSQIGPQYSTAQFRSPQISSSRTGDDDGGGRRRKQHQTETELPGCRHIQQRSAHDPP
jgi:hypothetical protein